MRRLLLISTVTLLHCNPQNQIAQKRSAIVEVDPVTNPPPDMSLLLLQPGLDRNRLIDLVEDKLHGTIFQMEGARLAIAKLPANADAVLQQSGVVARFQRSVDPSEIPSATTDETRFVQVFDSRYYPADAPKRIVAMRAVVEKPESPAIVPPVPPVGAPELDRFLTPYASGTIVVSLLMPESNGVAEPSTEDWTEDQIQETYLKVATALEAYVRSEPNAKLRFILHYESSPGHGGLPGTIDSDYECGLHFGFSAYSGEQDELNVTAPLLARILGHAVTPDQVYDASYEYLNNLRDQYHADGAYYLKITPNQNGTAGFRPHAKIGGPWAALDSLQGFQYFTHESGHIFGALDEYCEDICLATTSLQGYLGMVNANAAYFPGGDGIDHGMGEHQESLMNDMTDPDAIQGYTRGAWGWIDSDGDGLFDVRDTYPLTSVTPSLSGNQLIVSGTIVDQPEANLNGYNFRDFNRVVALEYRLADGATRGQWFSVPVSGPNVSVNLGAFPGGKHTVALRARNSVGNVEKVEKLVSFTAPGLIAGTAPRLRVDVSPQVGSIRSSFTINPVAQDYDALTVGLMTRIDWNGDGVYDTQWTTRGGSITTQFPAPGLYHVTAQARDGRGLVTTASTDVYVLDGNAPPAVTLGGVPSVVVGQAIATPTFNVVSGSDPDGDSVLYNWVVDGATNDVNFHSETGFSTANTRFTASLPTKETVDAQAMDLTAGDPALGHHDSLGRVALNPTTVASAYGNSGLLLSDISDPAKPAELALLQLESSADQLLLDGNKLYVLGGSALMAVDVSNPKAPLELKQPAVKKTHTLSATAPYAIPDGSKDGAIQTLFTDFSERITGVEIDAEVIHARPQDLTFTLTVNGATSQTFTLRDQVAGIGGDRVYKFTDANTPGLKALLGQLAEGEWDITVIDSVAGVSGTFQSATLILKTQTRAFQTLAKSRLVGVLPNHKIVVAGAGLQVVDASRTAMTAVSSLTGTGVYSGVLSGTTALVSSPFVAGGGKGPTDPTVLSDDTVTRPPQTHALYAVDLSIPSRPVVLRQDESFGDVYGVLAAVGSRAYLTIDQGRKGGASTQILDVAAFAANSAKYVLGTIPLGLTAIFGNDSLIWGVSGHVQAWNVSRPASPALVHDYVRPVSIIDVTTADATHYLLYDGGAVWLANLQQPLNILSSTYRVTLEAQDSQGAITTVSRTVQVVPYDHAPSVTAAVVSGANAGDTFQIQATLSDPDHSTTWDNQQWVRADLDGDGVYETVWQGGFSRIPPSFSVVFPTPGTYTVNLQVRDLFYALGTTQLTVNVR